MFWASSYNLFVHWSTNRSHPWDKMPKAETAACTLEIGKLRDSDNEARSLPNPPMWPPSLLPRAACAWKKIWKQQHSDDHLQTLLAVHVILFAVFDVGNILPRQAQFEDARVESLPECSLLSGAHNRQR